MKREDEEKMRQGEELANQHFIEFLSEMKATNPTEEEHVIISFFLAKIGHLAPTLMVLKENQIELVKKYFCRLLDTGMLLKKLDEKDAKV